MSKKLTPTGIGLDLAGDAIEGGLAGAGAALGGAAAPPHGHRAENWHTSNGMSLRMR